MKYISDAFGEQIEHWNGVDFSAKARLISGMTVQGGISTGRTSTDNCEVAAKLPELISTATTAVAAAAMCRPWTAHQN